MFEYRNDGIYECVFCQSARLGFEATVYEDDGGGAYVFYEMRCEECGNHTMVGMGYWELNEARDA